MFLYVPMVFLWNFWLSGSTTNSWTLGGAGVIIFAIWLHTQLNEPGSSALDSGKASQVLSKWVIEPPSPEKARDTEEGLPAEGIHSVDDGAESDCGCCGDDGDVDAG